MNLNIAYRSEPMVMNVPGKRYLPDIIPELPADSQQSVNVPAKRYLPDIIPELPEDRHQSVVDTTWPTVNR